MTNVFQLDDYRQPPEEPSAPLAEGARHTLADLDGLIRPKPPAGPPPLLGRRPPIGANRQLGETAKALLRERSAQRAGAGRRSAPPPPLENELVSVSPILVHSISWGRNAWNSTWIQRYRSGTLAENHAVARAFIEANRVQGSAYKVTVMPAWHLQFDRRAYLVCEINTSTPFSRLRRPAFADEAVTEAEALAMLDPGSDLWRGEKPLHDSIIVQATRLPASEFTPWASRSSHSGQARTPGRYARVACGRDWYLRPINATDMIQYDTSSFERLLEADLSQESYTVPSI